MSTLGITHSVCNTCRRLVPARVVIQDGDVFFEKYCAEHGTSRGLVRREVDDYLHTLTYVKPAWIPQERVGDDSAPCPNGCGFCRRHEQHLCLPIVEITSRCDLACPACLVSAGQPGDMRHKSEARAKGARSLRSRFRLVSHDMTRAEFARVLDALLAAERQIDILNLSGGEPLLHPDLMGLLDEALARPGIVRISISTNGLALLRRPGLLDGLQQRRVVVALQFDGFRPEIYEVLRGRPLFDEKLQILEMLRGRSVPTSLTMTVAGGINDDQFPALLDYFFAQAHVVSLMIQPLSFAGRGRQLAGIAKRLTIPDVIRLLGAAGVPQVRAQDFVPLPCSHPLCFNLAFYLMLEGGGSVSLNRLVEASRWLKTLANRTVFGLEREEHEQLKDMIFELWSGSPGTAPDAEAVLHTLRRVLDEMTCSCFDPRQVFAITERRVKSIFIHAFQDAETFDLARVRRCCNAYPQPDGTQIPVCIHNVLRRPGWHTREG